MENSIIWGEGGSEMSNSIIKKIQFISILDHFEGIKYLIFFKIFHNFGQNRGGLDRLWNFHIFFMKASLNSTKDILDISILYLTSPTLFVASVSKNNRRILNKVICTKYLVPCIPLHITSRHNSFSYSSPFAIF